MKKIIAYCSGLVLCAGLAISISAQSQDAQKTQVDKEAPQKLTDANMSQRLASDWNTRNSGLKNQSVDWFNTNGGYYGAYSIENKDYMSRYDKKGNYIETLNRKEWDDKIPANVKSSFDNSQYRSQQVTSYWEASNPSRKGYYMELKDDQNAVTRVWVDENGKFSKRPYEKKPII